MISLSSRCFYLIKVSSLVFDLISLHIHRLADDLCDFCLSTTVTNIGVLCFFVWSARIASCLSVSSLLSDGSLLYIHSQYNLDAALGSFSTHSSANILTSWATFEALERRSKLRIRAIDHRGWGRPLMSLLTHGMLKSIHINHTNHNRPLHFLLEGNQ